MSTARAGQEILQPSAEFAAERFASGQDALDGSTGDQRPRYRFLKGQDLAQHGGYERGVRDVLRLERAQCGRGFEPRLHPRRAALEQGQQQHPHPENERDLQDHQGSRARREAEHAVNRFELPHKSAMAEHDAFRLSGRARREYDQRRPVEQWSRRGHVAPDFNDAFVSGVGH